MKSGIFVTLLAFSLNAHAVLLDRGHGLIYDSDQNITWLSNANLAATQTFGVGGIETNGTMVGNTATNWLNAMNAFDGAGYLGYDNWRLTTDSCTPIATYNCIDSEFGYLFYNYLSGTAYSPISASSDADLSLFSNIQDTWYWTGSLSVGHIKVFDFGSGANSRTFGSLSKFHVWAVLDGDVAAMSEPSAFLLLSIGLIIFGMQKKSGFLQCKALARVQA